MRSQLTNAQLAYLNALFQSKQREVVIRMLKRFFYASSLVLSIMAAKVMAQSDPGYHIEVDVGLSSAGHGSSVLNEALGGEVSYYFGKIGNTASPLAERNFVNRRSSATVGYQHQQTEQTALFGIGPVDADIGDAKTESFSNNWEIGGTHHFVNSGLFLGGSYARAFPSGSDFGSNNESTIFVSTPQEESDIDRYGVTGGIYIQPQTRLSIEYSMTERSVEQHIELNLPFFIGSGSMTTRAETEIETWDVRLRHLGLVGALDYAATISYGRESTSVGFSSVDFTGNLSSSVSEFDVDKYALSTTLYPSKEVGVYLSYARADYSRTNADSYSLGTQWFINRSYAVLVQYSRTDLQFGQKSEAFAVKLKLRI